MIPKAQCGLVIVGIMSLDFLNIWKKEKRFKHYGNDPNDLLTLISNEIRFMTEDDLGRMWVGTDGGICFFDHEKDIFYRNTDGLKIPSTVSFTQASKGRMWISTYSGGGLVLSRSGYK